MATGCGARHAGAWRGILAAAATVALMAGSAASATDYIWTGGAHVAGTTSPNPLLAGDRLLIQATAANPFFASAFRNEGDVLWSAGRLFILNGVTVTNAGLWSASFDGTLQSDSTSARGSGFVNAGTFAKTGGVGTLELGLALPTLANSGVIDAQVGTIRLSAASMSFGAGTRFTGAGTVQLAGRTGQVTSFEGAIRSANLDFATLNGTYAAAPAGATLSGAADLLSGSFSGGWTLAAGATLTASGGADKGFGPGSFTNAGTIAWTGGNLLVDRQAFVNEGVIDVSVGTGAFASGTLILSGSTFTNSGTLRSSAVATIFGDGATFNSGSSFAGSGTVRLQGSAAFNGAFTSTSLDLSSGTFTGTGAVLGGSARFTGGTLAGDWTVGPGATLTMSGAGSRSIGGSFTNAAGGTVAWSEGRVLLLSGSRVDNAGQWTMAADGLQLASDTVGGGGLGFFNSGTLTKSAGTGTLALAGLNTLVNSGTVEALSGTFLLDARQMIFNDGTAFTGAGSVRIEAASPNGSVAFNGRISSDNLDFAQGVYLAGAGGATLFGTADFLRGTFAGNWTLAEGATLNLLGTGTGAADTVFRAGSFTNRGTLAWSGTNVDIAGNAFTNAGTIDLRSDAILLGGGGGSFVNSGTIVKSAGTGTSTIATGTALRNIGTIDVRRGTIALPADFANAGTLAGDGTFSLSGTLTNSGIMAPGEGGIAIGTLGLTGNYLQTAGGTLALQLSSRGFYDQLDVSGAAALGGILSLACVSCSFQVGDVLSLLRSGGGVSGSFADVLLSGFDSGFRYNLVYDTNAVRLRVTALGVPGAAGVPEPATWLSMILGFGLAGAAMRRRRPAAVA